jgi:ATP-dependent Clp protease ATP-binding subunit ClpC
LSERLLLKEFTAGQIIVVDVDDEIGDETDSKIVFKAVEGFEPPSVEEFITAE